MVTIRLPRRQHRSGDGPVVEGEIVAAIAADAAGGATGDSKEAATSGDA